jgi:uncharacterized protein YutE (UPF0331/DUF86 family)
MTYLLNRLAELRRHLAHLETLRPRATSADALSRDLSLHNDVLFSLLTVCQLVIDISAELSSEQTLPFDDYTQAVKNLARLDLLADEDVAVLARLPGFRNVLVHEYIVLDLERVVQALVDLEPVERFAEAVARRVGINED